MIPAVLLSYAGFTALCLAMDKHHGELLRRKPTAWQRRALAGAGWLLLGLAMAAAVSNAGWAMGLVNWTAGLMASAVLLVWLIPYQPRLALGIAAASVLVSPLAALGLA
jgi:hypothetical protein